MFFFADTNDPVSQLIPPVVSNDNDFGINLEETARANNPSPSCGSKVLTDFNLSGFASTSDSGQYSFTSIPSWGVNPDDPTNTDLAVELVSIKDFPSIEEQTEDLENNLARVISIDPALLSLTGDRTLAGIQYNQIDYLQVSASKELTQLKLGQYAIALNRIYLAVPKSYSHTKDLLSFRIATKITNRYNLQRVRYSLNELQQKLGFISGTLAINRGWEEHPRASLLVTDYYCNKERYFNLDNGSELSVLGLEFIVVNKQIKYNAPQVNPNGEIEITIPLVGKYSQSGAPSTSNLDRPVRLKDFINCNQYSAKIYLAQLANAVGVNYSSNGGTGIYRRIDSNIGAATWTTMRQLLQEKTSNFGQYAYYSNPHGVETRGWRSRVHNLSSRKILGRSPINLAGKNNRLQGTQLFKAYRNSEITLVDGSSSLQNEINNQVQIAWEFTNCASFADLQSPAIPVGLSQGGVSHYRLPNGDILKTPGTHAFDSGGFTKSARKIYRSRGTELFVIEWVWGWVATSLDSYRVVPSTEEQEKEGAGKYIPKFVVGSISNVQRYWRQVETNTTNHSFDEDGYLIKTTKQGRRLGRLRSESESNEAIATWDEYIELVRAYNETDDVETRQELQQKYLAAYQTAKTYKFSRFFPVEEITYYHLASLRNYYEDIKPPTRYDCFYVEPKFVRQKRRVKYERVLAEDPASTERNPRPPIIRTIRSGESTRIEILETKKPGRIKTVNYVDDARGRYERQKLRITGTTYSSGRPSIHLTLPRARPVDSENSIFRQHRYRRYLLSTQGVYDWPQGETSIYPLIEGGLSFPDFTDLADARRAADYRLAVENSLNAETFDLDLEYDSSICEGDEIIFEGESYLTKGITTVFKIEPKGAGYFISCALFKLALGKILEPQSRLTTIYTGSSQGGAKSSGTITPALDGRVAETNNIYNSLSPETVRRANAIDPKLLEDFAERNGNKVFGIEELQDPDKDIMQDWLDNQGGDSDFGDIELNGKQGKITDLRDKDDAEEFTDLINRLSLLKEFTNTLKDLVIEEFDSEQNGGGGSGDSGGSGGSGGSNIIADFDQPNITTLGREDLLGDFLSDMISALQELLALLLGNGGGGGGGATGVGGGGGGGGGAGGGGGGEPIFQIGDLTIYIDPQDPYALINAILKLLLEAIAAVKGFNFDIASLSAALERSGSFRSGGGVSGGDNNLGNNTQINTTTIYLQPEGLEPANITRIYNPGLSLEDLDLTEVFAYFDELLNLLDELANREFDFDLDLSILELGSGVVNSKSGEGDDTSQGGSFSSVDLSGGSFSQSGGSGSISSQTIYKIAKYEDITGIIGGGISGNTTMPNFSPVGGVSGGAGSGAGAGDNTNTTTSDYNFGTDSVGGISTNVDADGNTTTFNSGNPNELTPDSTDLSTLSPDAIAYQIIPAVIVNKSDTGFSYPVSLSPLLPFIDPEVAELTVAAPGDITIAFDGGVTQLIVDGAIANDAIYWSLAPGSSDNILESIEVVTPYDLEPTIRISPTYIGHKFTLVITSRIDPNVSDSLSVETTIVSRLRAPSLYTQAGNRIIWRNLAVDVDRLEIDLSSSTLPNSFALFETTVGYSWGHPNNSQLNNQNSAWILKRYIVERRTFYGWQQEGAVINVSDNFRESALFSKGATYRIATYYQNNDAPFYSQEFTAGSEGLLGGADSSLSANVNTQFEQTALDLSYKDDGSFYTRITDFDLTSTLSLVNNPDETFATSSSALVANNLSYEDSGPFFVRNSTIELDSTLDVDDSLVYATDSIINSNLVYQDTNPFYSV